MRLLGPEACLGTAVEVPRVLLLMLATGGKACGREALRLSRQQANADGREAPAKRNDQRRGRCSSAPPTQAATRAPRG